MVNSWFQRAAQLTRRLLGGVTLLGWNILFYLEFFLKDFSVVSSHKAIKQLRPAKTHPL